MEELVFWLTQGSPAIDALFIARLVLVMMGLELITCMCGMLAKLRK